MLPNVLVACWKANSFCRVEITTPIHTQKEFLVMIPSSEVFDQSTLASLLEHDPLIADYRAFFALLDWAVVDDWQAHRSCRGRPAHPESAYLKAFLLRIREGMVYTTQLRRFLLRHPLLVIELGFRLVLDPTAAYGFDVEQTRSEEHTSELQSLTNL